MIRLTIPSIEEDDLQAVRDVIASGYLVQGQHVAAFEQVVADYVGTQYAVAVSNCTAALHLALLALDVRAGDLVLVTTYSWIATANVIELCGAQPVFVEIAPHTFNMDVEALAETLERLMILPATARRVKAILPVHTFGLMADLTSIQKLADKYDMPIVEDAACALGAEIQGRKAGSWGRLGCFSFHPRKAVTTGEGGVVTTNDPLLAHRLRSLRNHGFELDESVSDFVEPGFNYRLTEFQAALGCTQMAKLERIIHARQSAAQRYDQLLAASGFQPPFVPQNHRHVYQSYVVLLPQSLADRRAELIDQLKINGVETTIGTRHMPMAKYFRTRYGYEAGDFPVTDDVFERSLTLPLFETITLEQQTEVVECLLSFVKSA